MLNRAGEGRARVLALAAVVMWGVSFVATKRALEELSPIALITMRFVLGVIVLHVILRVRGIPLVPPRTAWPQLALMGFIGVAFHQTLQANALTMTTARDGAAPSTWNNPRSGSSGTITVINTTQRADGVMCRRFRQTVTTNGKTQTGEGTACLRNNNWQIVT